MKAEFHADFTRTTPLGAAVLLIEDEDGHFEPLSIVADIDEAEQIADRDLADRLVIANEGGDPGLCPYRYRVWARLPNENGGRFCVVWEGDPALTSVPGNATNPRPSAATFR